MPRVTRYGTPRLSFHANIISPLHALYDALILLLDVPQVYQYRYPFNSAPVLYAGTGASGYSGDGGAATSATFNVPHGVLADSTGGNVYVADINNNCVRVIVMSSRIISTLASYTSFWGPSGVKLDSVNGILYVAECFSSTSHSDVRPDRVSKVVLSTMQVSVAYGPTYSLWGVDDLDVDSGGNLFITQLGNNCVSYFQASNSALYPVAGDCNRFPLSYSGDGGPATSARLGIPGGMIVVDQINGRFLFVDNQCDACPYGVVRSVQMSFPYLASSAIMQPSR